MGKKNKSCDPVVCGMEAKVEKVMERFYHIAEKLTENQQSMQIQIVKLTENMQAIAKMDDRMDGMEQDIKTNSMMMYKMVGGAVEVAALIPVLMNYL